MSRKKTVQADERANLLDHPHIKTKPVPALPPLSPDELAFLKKLADTTVDPSLDPKRDLSSIGDKDPSEH